MGWAYGTDKNGREIGYGIVATCDEISCDKIIDRGLAFVCGGKHDGGDKGCGNYFCYAHLYLVSYSDDKAEQFCRRCADKLKERQSNV